MKTYNILRIMGLLAITLFGGSVKAQWISGTGGRQYLNATEGVRVGTTTTSPPAALTVNGDEMSTPTGEVFQTVGITTAENNWKLYRGTNEMGRIYAPASGSGDSFNVKAVKDQSSLWLRNSENDGIRIRSNASVSMTYGGYTLLRDGYGAVGPSASLGNNKAWARWHLNHSSGSDNEEGWRPHMRNGTLATGNSDLAYFGQMYDMGSSGTGSEVNNNSNALVGWGSNGITAATNEWDNCTFRFYTNPTNTNAGSAATVRGLEIMRLRPYRATSTSAMEGFVGLGDWAAGTDLPTERLHLLTGRMRLEALPGSTEATSPYKVMVVDDAASGGERGVVKWKDPNTMDCKWEMDTSSPYHMHTAVSSTTTCPDDASAVGIGVDLSITSPTAKLEVMTDVFSTALEVNNNLSTTGNNYGVVSNSSGGDFNVAVLASALSAGVTNYGVFSETAGAQTTGIAGYFLAADDGLLAYGVVGEASGDPSNESVGVRGDSWGEANGNYGVEGRALGTGTGGGVYIGVRGEGPTQGNSWGMWCEGKQFSSTSSTWSTSDAMLKTNIQDMSGMLDRVLLLQPKEFDFNLAEYGFMHLPTEHQYGLIAQDVELVFPEFVAEVRRPADLDSVGNEIHPVVDFKAMQYGGLIPILVAALKEQNATITALQDQVATMQPQSDAIQALQEQLALLSAEVMNCCAIGGGMQGQGAGDQRGLVVDGDLVGEGGNKLTIQPNPFGERTTLYYTVERAGRAQLMVNSADGKQLRVLNEAVLEPGQYRYEWNTADLNPGMYYVTFLLNGEPIVKKAVRVRE